MNESTKRKPERTPLWVWLVIALPVLGLIVIAATTPDRNLITVSFVGALPGDDIRLIEWLKSQPGLSGVRVSRSGTQLELRYRTRPIGPRSSSFLVVPWGELGYELPSSFYFQVSPGWLPSQ